MDLVALKKIWIKALEDVQEFSETAPVNELGCLYYDVDEKKFVQPDFTKKVSKKVVVHYGQLGGVYPLIKDHS